MLWFILRFHLGRKKVLQELKTSPNEIKNTTAKTTESGPGWDVVWDTCNQKKPKHYYWLSPVGCKGLLSLPTRTLALSSWGHSAPHVNTGGVHAPANLYLSYRWHSGFQSLCQSMGSLYKEWDNNLASETFWRITKVHVICQRALNFRQNIKEVFNLWYKMKASSRVNWNWKVRGLQSKNRKLPREALTTKPFHFCTNHPDSILWKRQKLLPLSTDCINVWDMVK